MTSRPSFTLLGLVLTLLLSPGPSTAQEMPHLREQEATTQLIVNGEPFLVIGGELGNSTASSLEYMEPIWPKLEQMNLNTVLAPVY